MKSILLCNPEYMDNIVGSQQFDSIVGTLLRDSFLERNGRYPRLVADHSLVQKDYVEWKASQLLAFHPRISFVNRFDLRTKKRYQHCVLRTLSSPSLEMFYELFYVEGKKRLPKSLPSLISPQMLAIWAMDDGYKRNDCRAFRGLTHNHTRCPSRE